MRKLLLSLFIASALVIIGCNRDEANPEGRAVVYVVDENGTPIQNALVFFKSPTSVPDGIEIYKYTEIDGSASMRWNYHVFADVIAAKGGFKGCSAAEIRPGETTETTVVMYPFGSPANGCPQ